MLRAASGEALPVTIPRRSAVSYARAPNGSDKHRTVRTAGGWTPRQLGRAKWEEPEFGVPPPGPVQKEEWTELHTAAVAGRVGSLLELLEGGGSKDATAGGATPLYLAASAGEVGAVEALIAAGAKKEKRHFGNGETPLLAAVAAGHLSVVRALSRAGALRNASNRSGLTPELLAGFRGDREAVEALLAGPQTGDVKPPPRRRPRPRSSPALRRPSPTIAGVSRGPAPHRQVVGERRGPAPHQAVGRVLVN